MGASAQGGGRGRGPIVGINVTPMVDVMLVLLVIMMVSATYIVSQSLKVALPKAANSDASPSSPATITITKDGVLKIDGRDVDEAQLSARLHAAHATNRDVSLVVTADREAQHGSVVRVIDLAKSAGITSFAIHVERRAE